MIRQRVQWSEHEIFYETTHKLRPLIYVWLAVGLDTFVSLLARISVFVLVFVLTTRILVVAFALVEVIFKSYIALGSCHE